MPKPFIIPPAQLREMADSRRKIHDDARAALLLAAHAIETLQSKITVVETLCEREARVVDLGNDPVWVNRTEVIEVAKVRAALNTEAR